MSYKRKPIYEFATKDDIGLNKIPNGSTIVVRDYDGVSKQFTKNDPDGTLAADTTVATAIADGLAGNALTEAATKNTAVTGTATLVRHDKVLGTLSVVEMVYDDDKVLTAVRYDGDADTEAPYYRDVMEYTDGDLTEVKHYYNTADLGTASGTTTLSYNADGDLVTTSYTE